MFTISSPVEVTVAVQAAGAHEIEVAARERIFAVFGHVEPGAGEYQHEFMKIVFVNEIGVEQVFFPDHPDAGTRFVENTAPRHPVRMVSRFPADFHGCNPSLS